MCILQLYVLLALYILEHPNLYTKKKRTKKIAGGGRCCLLEEWGNISQQNIFIKNTFGY